METKGTKRKKKRATAERAKEGKKRKLAVEQVPSEAPSVEPAVVPRNDPDVSSLRKEIMEWIEQQAEYERKDLDALLEESNHSTEQEEVVDLEHIEKPLKTLLHGYTEDEIRKSVKYECEWSKCTFLSGNDRKYFLHVESHAEQTTDSQSGSYACEWDLCGFVTEDDDEYMGHVHYHAYHTKLKVHGAGVHMLAKLPSCNYDSRARNTITNTPVTFRCEWQDCNERFNKAMHFFHHVRNHVCDLFPTSSKTSVNGVDCLWSLCKERFKMRYFALEHVKKHTTEREIACFTCGTTFWARSKLTDHLVRQIEISQRKYECAECGRFYATKTLLNAHIERHNLSHECTLCPFKAASPSLLTKHMLRIHLKQRNFKCNQCEYAGYTQTELKTHLRTHDKTKVFRCEEFGCNVAFRSLLAMRKHFAWHYNLPSTMYGCHICSNKTYKNSFHLTKHLKFVHKLERPPGCRRFLYKTDSDGVNRLATHVEQKQKQTKANETPVLAEKTVAKNQKDIKTAAGVKNRKEAKAKENAPERSNAVKQEELAHDASTAYAPIKGTPKISSVKAVGKHEFLIELAMEPEPAEAEQTAAVTGPVESVNVSKPNRNDTPKPSKRSSEMVRVKQEKEPVADHRTPHVEESATDVVDVAPQAAQKPKDVKDFTVMKRYLKSSKKSAQVSN